MLALWCEQGKLLPATLASHTQRPGSLASDLTPWERPAESSSRWPKRSWALTCAWETLSEALGFSLVQAWWLQSCGERTSRLQTSVTLSNKSWEGEKKGKKR